MESEFALQELQGKLFCRNDGQRCHLCAEGRDDGRGLYKVYLHGGQGSMLMGTLMPEQGMLRLRRSISIAELKRKNCWPIADAHAELAFSFSEDEGNAVPEGWQRAEHLADMLQDEILRKSAAELKEAFIRWEETGFLLAMPYEERKPFPLTPLFCLGTFCRLGERGYIVFCFDRSGVPRILGHRKKVRA